MQKTLLCILPILLPSCIVAAAAGVGAAAGILVHEAYIAEDTYQGIFRADLDDAFDAALQVMEDLAIENMPTHDRELSSIEGEVNGATVLIKVHPYDTNKVSVSVQARKHGFADRDIAVHVFRKIENRLTS